jgi:hypothetical protein
MLPLIIVPIIIFLDDAPFLGEEVSGPLGVDCQCRGRVE